MNRENLKEYIHRGVGYLVWAVFIGLLTVWYWFISGGNMFMAYFWNVVGISAMLIIDKIRISRIYKKLETPCDEAATAKLAKKDVGSLKTSLYLFYLAALIMSQVSAMDIPITFSANMQGYLQSVGYGVVLLFAIDRFFGHLMKDNERIKKFKNKFTPRKDNML